VAGPQDAPHFAVEALPSGKEVVRTVEAMGAVSFEVTPRVLPPVMQCDVELATSVAAIGKVRPSPPLPSAPNLGGYARRLAYTPANELFSSKERFSLAENTTTK
jgi:hypothetical protein